jgi:hypothetical protein
MTWPLDAAPGPGSLAGEGVQTAPLPPGCVAGVVATNGIRLHYVAVGSGPLVLLLHGFPEFCSP